jgi:hypothetical protein
MRRISWILLDKYLVETTGQLHDLNCRQSVSWELVATHLRNYWIWIVQGFDFSYFLLISVLMFASMVAEWKENKINYSMKGFDNGRSITSE